MSTRWLWPNSKVVRVIDGDSFVARVTRDIGFHGTTTFEVKLRLNRINAPARSTKAGKLAWAATDELLLGETLSPAYYVDIETVGPYKYGDEWMAEVTTPDGRNVSDTLVVDNHAVYWDGQGPRPADG